jgi:hypothetical protein
MGRSPAGDGPGEVVIEKYPLPLRERVRVRVRVKFLE